MGPAIVIIWGYGVVLRLLTVCGGLTGMMWWAKMNELAATDEL